VGYFRGDFRVRILYNKDYRINADRLPGTATPGE
jgi:hypothetical protein